VAQPRLAAAFMGTLIKGLGVDHVVWGTDALWTGSPQWQLGSEGRLFASRRLPHKHALWLRAQAGLSAES
jgi:uncharacterized protein